MDKREAIDEAKDGSLREMGVAPGDLSEDELRQELTHLYETRQQTFFDGSPQALRHHTERMFELEQEYLRRFPSETEPDPDRTREGARARSGQDG